MPNTREGSAVGEEVPSEASRKFDALRSNLLVKAIGALLLACVPAVGAWSSSIHSAREKVAEAKDKAEAGFQQSADRLEQQQRFNRDVVEDLQRLKAEVAELKRRQIRPIKRKEAAKTAAVAAVPAPSPPPTVPSTPLAPNLDKALEQVKAAATPPAPAAPPPAER